MRIRNYVRSIAYGALAGVIVMYGALISEREVAAVGIDMICYEDEPCWDAGTMGDHRRGQVNDPAYADYPEDYTVCRWDGTEWLWDYSPFAQFNLPCPFDY